MDIGKLIATFGNWQGGRRRLFGLAVVFLFAILAGGPGVQAQNAGAITDLLKGGSGSSGPEPDQTTPPTYTVPGFETANKVPPLVVTQPSSGTGTPPAPAMAQTLAYDGQAAADGRKARITLSFNGTAVEGTIWIQSVCETNVHLGGADLTLSATLSGAWESKDGSIDGTWQGSEHFCGSDVPNHGTLKFFLKDDGYFDPVLHLRLMGERGQYGWNFPPKGKVFVDAGASVAVAPPTDDEESGKKDDKGDDEGRVPDEDINPDDVTDLILLPRLLAMSPGESVEFPDVLAVIGEEARRVFLPKAAMKWIEVPPGPLEIRDGTQFFLTASAQNGAEIPFQVAVDLGDGERVLEGKVRVFAKEQLGSISGVVYFDYSPTLMPNPRLRPKSAEVELHRGTYLGAPIAVIKAAADGSFRFDNLPKGYYVVGVRKLDPPDFPSGYVLDTGSAPWRSMTTAVPDEVFVEAADEMQLVWDREHISVGAKVVQPPVTDGAVYGRVHYKDKGIEGVTVLARQVGSTGVKQSVTSGRDGFYLLKINDLPGGTYWITAEKYVTPRWAGPDDLLDTASTRLQTPILVSVPLYDPRGVEISIELDSRNAIFGGSRTPVEPIPLPGDG